jgi:ABC-2 type transport system ATP-binding protein
MNAVEISGLTKSYKGRTAVDQLNLEIANGQLFSLLGPNGAGKTTTIRMLCCLTAPTSGDALLCGESIVKNPAGVRALINVSPQETAVAQKLSVRENLELIAEIYGMRRREARETAETMMRDFSLTDRARDRSRKLSGGLQRRLSIAMALISSPRVLFLDEPTLGLDVRARRDLWKHVEALKGKMTIILTTHYLEEAEALSDRIGILNQGRLSALGTAEEIVRASGKPNFEEAFLSLTDEGVEA